MHPKTNREDRDNGRDGLTHLRSPSEALTFSTIFSHCVPLPDAGAPEIMTFNGTVACAALSAATGGVDVAVADVTACEAFFRL